MDELKKLVESSTDEEVKSFLYLMLFRIDLAEDTDQYTEMQLVKDMKKTYHDFLNYKKKQAELENSKSYEGYHIVFGDSPAGSLRMAMSDTGMQDKEKMIAFSDLFSVGPVWKLHEKEGLRNRYEWLINHLNLDEKYMLHYIDDFNRAVSMVTTIPENRPVTIWVGDSAHEQTALRFALFLLKEKANDIFIVNTTTPYKTERGTEIITLHMGEMDHERLINIYEENRKVPPLSSEKRKQLEEEWQQLASNKEVLRIWENQAIHSVQESYYDGYIIQAAEKLHSEQEKKDFMKSARLIGEVIGHSNQYLGDLFWEYRLMHLILTGVFEIKGVPRAMRFYSVKLK
ncbi:DUF1835 domain-containing protein [Aquibacillus kalidii]|uniref:DUF1835 domain-containing protein n=1 Tax=Aquibacillus kalidii TaxID=2762597 RepID=UPI002E28016D|nr:DUF1835 domain-containing protein [Aquibacillus kalidii]